MSHNIKYLGNHAEQLSNDGQFVEGELYVVGRDKNALIAFRMPSGKDVSRRGEEIALRNIDKYEARLCKDGQEIDEEVLYEESSLTIDTFLDFNPKMSGVFRPTQNSRLRQTIEKALSEDSPLRKSSREAAE